MAKAYTPGLKVSARTTHRSRRLLPIQGEVKVSVVHGVGGMFSAAATAVLTSEDRW